MKTKMFVSLLAAVSLCVVVPATAQEKSSGKTATASDTTTKTTKAGTSKAAATRQETSSKGQKADGKASGPTQNVDVNIAGTGVSLPISSISAGRVIFTVLNQSEKPHKIGIEGGTLKNIEVSVPMNTSGKVEVTLTPGTYKLRCTIKEHHESSAKLTVK